MEIDDEVVMELDVVTESSDNFYLLQYPLRPRYRPYGDQGTLKSGSLTGETLNLVYTLNTNSLNFDRSNSEFKQENQVLMGKAIIPINKYCIGVIKDGQFNITTLNKIFQVRPDTKHLDAVLDKRQIDDVEELAQLKQEKESKKLRVFKKKEVKESEIEHQTINLTCHDMYSKESKDSLSQLSISNTKKIPEFIPRETYLKQILPQPIANLSFADRIHSLPIILAIEELLKEVNIISTEEASEFFPNEKNIESHLIQKATVIDGRWVRRSEILKEPLSRDLCLFTIRQKGGIVRSE